MAEPTHGEIFDACRKEILRQLYEQRGSFILIDPQLVVGRLFPALSEGERRKSGGDTTEWLKRHGYIEGRAMTPPLQGQWSLCITPKGLAEYEKLSAPKP